MPFFDDFANAVAGYPAASVTLSIVDVAVVPPGIGPSVTVNEIWRFQVRVKNNGHLNMTSLTLHLVGLNGALVSANAVGPFSALITTSAITVNSHGTQDTVDYFFKAPNVVKPAGTALVEAHINNFNGNLDHILNDHSGHANPPAGTYSNQVFPA